MHSDNCILVSIGYFIHLLCSITRGGGGEDRLPGAWLAGGGVAGREAELTDTEDGDTLRLGVPLLHRYIIINVTH